MREFRALWVAELLSVAGDQLARVGLAVLVYRDTGSAGWTALTYALTYLPALLGGVLLGGLADRYPRRELMVIVDLLRAVIAGLMAIPTLPLPVLLGLVCLLALGSGPFKAAQQALLPAILTGDRYVNGLSLRTVTNQATQVFGFLGGGALLILLDPFVALGLNATTFLLAAIVVATGVRHRPPPTPGESGRTTGTARYIWQDPKLRALVALSWLVGLFTVPEGLAAPYADTLGVTGAVTGAAVGLLMAADPAGSIVGAWFVTRVPEHARAGMTTWLAVVSGIPLAACLFRPPLAIVVVLWATSGACTTAYLILAQAAFVLGVPDHRRGAASGLVGAGVLSSQGLAVLGAGVLADATSPVLAVATGGVAGMALTSLAGGSSRRARTRQGRTRAKAGGRETEDADQEAELTSPYPSSAPPPADQAAEHGSGDAGSIIVARREQAPTPDAASEAAPRPSRAPRQWPLWQVPARVLIFIVTVEAVAVGVTVLLGVSGGAIPRGAFGTFGVIIGLGLVVAELTRHIERVRRRFNDTPHVNFTSVWVIPAALLLPPLLAGGVVVVLYLHLFWRSWYRVRGVHAYRLTFSATSMVLSAYATSLITRPVAPDELARWTEASTIGVIVLGLLAFSTVNSGLVGAAICLFDGRLDVRRAYGTARENALEYGTLGLGAITGLLLITHPLWPLIMVPALLVLHRNVLMRQLEEAASTDQQTGLANATAWTNLAAQEILRAARDDTQVGVLMVDLDHFKAVNDTHGHEVGDQVLQAVADTLSATAGRYDVVGRWGGEEFVVLCPETPPEALRQLGERICEKVRELRVPVAEQCVIDGLSVSIGIASYPEFGPDLQDVLLAADDALFVAKDSGRNQVQEIVHAIGTVP